MSLKFKTNIILERKAKIKIFIIIRKSNVLPASHRIRERKRENVFKNKIYVT